MYLRAYLRIFLKGTENNLSKKALLRLLIIFKSREAGLLQLPSRAGRGDATRRLHAARGMSRGVRERERDKGRAVVRIHNIILYSRPCILFILLCTNH